MHACAYRLTQSWKNPQICHFSFPIQVHRMNECLVLTLLFLMNNPVTRCYVRPDVGLEVMCTSNVCCMMLNCEMWTVYDVTKWNISFIPPIFQGILAPFTDLHYNHGIEIPDSQLRYIYKVLFYTQYVYSKDYLVYLLQTFRTLISDYWTTKFNVVFLFSGRIVNHDYKRAKWRWLLCLKRGQVCWFLLLHYLNVPKVIKRPILSHEMFTRVLFRIGLADILMFFRQAVIKDVLHIYNLNWTVCIRTVLAFQFIWIVHLIYVIISVLCNYVKPQPRRVYLPRIFLKQK